MQFQQELLLPDQPLSALPAKSPLSSADWVVVFGSVRRFGEKKLTRLLRKRYPRAQIIGCSTSGEITRDGVYDDSLHITAIAWESTRMRVVARTISDAEQSHALGVQIGKELMADDLRGVFLLTDGLHVNGSELVEGMQEVVRQVPVSGGMAGDDANLSHTLLMHNEVVRERMVIAVGLYGDDVVLSSGALGGWKPYGPPRTVTRADKHIIYELDHKPALQLYKMYIGYYAKQLPASGLNFPFAIITAEREVNVIRTVLAIDEESQSISFGGNIDEGATIRFVQSNHDRLVDAASGAARQVIDGNINLEDPAVAICVSCVGRKLVMAEQVADEVHAVRGLLGRQTALTGFYSYGEIARSQSSGEQSLLHNQTMTIAYMSERRH